jgi:glycosyltransferase involved in cell wall biosynthesis
MLTPLADRGPLNVLFVITSMPVGGAETLLVNLIRRLDRSRFLPELCCLKELGPLGEELAREIPAHHGFIGHKYDFLVLRRLTRLLRERRIDAVVTVGAGDKMFWGRLAAWRAGVPVVLSALHSTGWPDGVGKLNRLLTPLTDAFIGVAEAHGRHLIENERFPTEKVRVIPNGVDVERFRPQPEARLRLRSELGLPECAPVCGIVAALRPEKNHMLFLRTADLVRNKLPEAHFLIVGDGPERARLEHAAREARFGENMRFLGTRGDIPEILGALDLFALTSHNEANPVSILEALATGVPVVSTRVGSVAESVEPGVTGFLAEPGDAEELARHWLALLSDSQAAVQMGLAGREKVVARWSLERMVGGYEELIREIYERKCASNEITNHHRVAGGVPARREAAPQRSTESLAP